MIVEIFSDICKRVSSEVGYDVNYIFGDSTYIREAILTQKKIPQTATKRFPLIGLYTPFVEDKTDSKVYCKADVNIIIAVNTLKDYTNEQRIEVSFKGLLRPLYDALIKEMGAEKGLILDIRGMWLILIRKILYSVEEALLTLTERRLKKRLMLLK